MKLIFLILFSVTVFAQRIEDIYIVMDSLPIGLDSVKFIFYKLSVSNKSDFNLHVNDITIVNDSEFIIHTNRHPSGIYMIEVFGIKDNAGNWIDTNYNSGIYEMR